MLAPGLCWPFKVLVVEDDPTNRFMLRKILDRFVRSSAEANDGLEALALVEEYLPDLIITDLSMPNLDGMALVKALRERGNPTPVIVLSAHNEDHIIGQVASDNILSFLTKPVKVDKIIANLESLAAARGISPEPRAPGA
jgi:CheY-like chemotaxis protein